jgi:hypothetical protein
MPKRLKSFSYQIALMLFSILFLSLFAFAQNKTERVLKRMSLGGDSPVEIVSIKAKGVAIVPNQKFTDSDDWLQDLTFTIKNISDKPIVFVSVYLSFPAPAGSRVAGAGYDLRYGKYQVLPDVPNSGDKPKAIKPEESIDLTLSE